jgi:RNA polymerase sigma-70 factor (ECF subfamily)
MRAYQDMVFSTAARLTGNDAQAEDIAQDVFLRAYESFDRLRNSPAAGGEEFAIPDPAPESVSAAIDAGQRQALVEQALRELPEHQRVPLVLYHFEEMPYGEIAKPLHVSLAKVKTDILRGRAALAKKLPRAGLSNVGASTVSVGDLLLHSIPPTWLYGAAAAGFVLYACLFALGTVAYRTLYLQR